jgi:cytoskeletal protein RodZ
VTVGQTLTKARSQAGLSVEELSERTRIRGTVIRSIEQDDYAACGGDLYVHGYVRALAGAVGIDAQPLIREYDLGRVSDPAERANGSAGQPSAPTSYDLPAVTADPVTRDAAASAADLGATRYDLQAVREAAPATSYDLPRVPEDLGSAPEDLMAAGYDLSPTAEPGEAGSATMIIPAPAPDPADSQPVAVWTAPRLGGAGPADLASARTARKKRRGFFAVAAAVVVIAAAGLSIRLATAGGTTIKNTAATSAPSPSASAAAARASAAAQASESAAAARASASAQASASASAQARQAAAARAAAQRVISLPVASAMAFGPDGFADGDDSVGAGNVIARNASQPWSTQWYNTATFGLLKHGTGLLLDLGGKDTVTSVRLDLAQYQGADLQLRVGNGTALPNLKLAATADNAGGVVTLTLHHPVAARYLLIWFTQLPPNGSGQYAETVSHVAVSGRR